MEVADPNALPGQSGHAPVPIPTRAPSTTIDALEREFQRKKKRELDLARAASSAGAESNGATPRRTGEKIGRNDECPCGSGKKYKKCHGAEAQGFVGPAIAGNPATKDAKLLEAIVRNGIRRMPPVGNGWTDAEVAALSAYFKAHTFKGATSG